MPRKGPAYPFTPDWQQRVKDRIAEMIRDGEVSSQNDFARQANIAESTLCETLAKGAKQTTVMIEIHRKLGWPEPLISPPNHVLELVHAFERLPALEQGRILEQLRQAVEHERRRR